MLGIISIVVTAVAMPHLGETLQLRWQVGSYRYWGPTSVSTEPGLALFTILIVGLIGMSWWLHRQIESDPDTQLLITVIGVGLATIIVIIQLVLIGLNVVVG